MFATNHFETQILNTMRGITLQAPAALYLALFLNNPTETGTAGTEASYEGYTRVPITFSTPAASESGMYVQNDSQLTFATSPIAAGKVTHIGLMDAPSGGNMWAYGKLQELLDILENMAPVFTTGTVKYELVGDLCVPYKTKYLNVLRGESVEGFKPYAALFDNDPENGGAELKGDNYGRVLLEMTAPAEADNSQMRSQNSTDTMFERPSASWGTWRYNVLYDAQENGQPVWKKAQPTVLELKAGYLPILPAGKVSVAVN